MLVNRRSFAILGLASLGLGAAPPTTPAVKPTSAVKPASAVVIDPVTARDPLASLLADARTGYARLRDYTCTFTRQDRVGGVLSAEQVAELKVRVQPLGIVIRIARPESLAGQEMVYAERTGPVSKMKMKPAGSNDYRILSIDDPKVLAVSRRPITQQGMNAILDTLSEVVRREKALNNPVEVYSSDYLFAGRPVTRYEIFTRRPHTHRTFYRAVICVDKEMKLPVRYEAYDQPRSGGPSLGDLMEVYSYSDIRSNVGLGDSTFSR